MDTKTQELIDLTCQNYRLCELCSSFYKRCTELTQQRDELMAIADGINTRRQLRGFLVPEDAQDLLEAIAKVKQS